MLYQAYQFCSDAMAPARSMAQLGLAAANPLAHGGKAGWFGNFTAACELISRASLSHTRPPYGIKTVCVGGRNIEVTEEPLAVTPFGTLLHFKKDIRQV